MLRCLVIIGRGAPALQASQAVRDLPVRAVLLHLSEDRCTRFVRDAEVAVELGSVKEHLYGDASALQRELTELGADAVWIAGWPEVDNCVRQVCRRLGLPLDSVSGLGAAGAIDTIAGCGAGCEPDTFVGAGAEVAGGVDRLVADLRRALNLPPVVPVVAPFAAAAQVRLIDLDNGSEGARRIRLLELPGGAGIQVDAGVSQGDAICGVGRPVLARITAYGATEGEAVARLERALKGTTVIVDGATTSQGRVAHRPTSGGCWSGRADHRGD